MDQGNIEILCKFNIIIDICTCYYLLTLHYFVILPVFLKKNKFNFLIIPIQKPENINK